MQTHYLPIAVGLFVAALMPADVSAQLVGADSAPPESMRRPYRGLFGSSNNPDAPQSLVLSASLFGAYDDNVAAGLRGDQSIDPRLHRRGAYAGANAGLNYSLAHTGERVSFGVAGTGAVSGYYFDGDRSMSPHFAGAANVGFSLTRSTKVGIGYQAAYSRYYRFLLFPGLDGTDDNGAVTADPDLDLFRRTAIHHGVNATLTHTLGPRSSLSAGYGASYVDFRDGTTSDWVSHSAFAAYNYRVTSHATLNLGYGYRVAESRERSRAREVHSINAGMSYSRALSFSRRTSLSFSSGSAIMVNDAVDGRSSDPRTRFRVLGNIALKHELGRTWTAQATYHRGLVFREGFDDPFFSDAVTAGIGGLVTRRLDLSAEARWALADLDRSGQSNHDAFSATAQARYAVSSYLAMFVRYVYYQYEFGEDVPLDPGLFRSLDRQGVRVGITTSLPLIR